MLGGVLVEERERLLPPSMLQMLFNRLCRGQRGVRGRGNVDSRLLPHVLLQMLFNRCCHFPLALQRAPVPCAAYVSASSLAPTAKPPSPVRLPLQPIPEPRICSVSGPVETGRRTENTGEGDAAVEEGAL